jgi:hypothetical protein
VEGDLSFPAAGLVEVKNIRATGVQVDKKSGAQNTRSGSRQNRHAEHHDTGNTAISVFPEPP